MLKPFGPYGCKKCHRLLDYNDKMWKCSFFMSFHVRFRWLDDKPQYKQWHNFVHIMHILVLLYKNKQYTQTAIQCKQSVKVWPDTIWYICVGMRLTCVFSVVILGLNRGKNVNLTCLVSKEAQIYIQNPLHNSLK